MLDQIDILCLADSVCDYCGMPYIVTADQFVNDSDQDEFQQCQDCNIADWKYGGPWHQRYDEIYGGN